MASVNSPIIDSQTAAYVPHRRGRLLAVFVAITLACVSVAWTCTYLKAHSRYTVVCQKDNPNGYRITYTVSSRFHKSSDETAGNGANRIDTVQYLPAQDNGIVSWLNKHILHRSTTSVTAPYTWAPGMIRQSIYSGIVRAYFKTDPQGFPDASFWKSFGKDVVLERRIINGCPTTFCGFTYRVSRGHQMRCYTLIIQPQDRSAVYTFNAIDDPSNLTGVDKEMKKIRDSIQIGKAK